MKRPTFKLPTLTLPSRLTTLLRLKPHSSQPVFNRPLNTERELRASRVLHLTLLSVLVGLSMAVIGLKALTLAFIEDNHDTGFAFETGDPEPTILAALPKQLHTAPAKLAIVAGVVAFSIGMVHGGIVVWDWRDGKWTQSYAFRRNTMFLHFSNSVLVLFSLVSIFITHKSTSHFRQGYIMRQADRSQPENSTIPVISPNATSFTNPNRHDDNAIRYNIGTFDLETWSCELKDVPGAAAVWSEYERQCGIEMVGRVLVIPLVAISFLIAGACIRQMMRYRRDANGERIKTEDVSVEIGKLTHDV